MRASWTRCGPSKFAFVSDCTHTYSGSGWPARCVCWQSACAPPDKSIAIFRPLKGCEENTDVAIFAQIIEPSVRAREHDGTAVFYVIGTGGRLRNTIPDELIMVCVDCSHSMQESSDFAEINDSQNDPQVKPTNDDEFIEDLDDVPASLGDAKDWISEHESLPDMISLIRGTTKTRQSSLAGQIIAFLRKLTLREFQFYVEKETKTRNWASLSHPRDRSVEGRTAVLLTILTGLNTYEHALRDLLVFKARDTGSLVSLADGFWRFGEGVPKIEKPALGSENLNIDEELNIPADFICPITQKLFQDPVRTSDGFTFERRAIERWYQIRNSSPLTGLVLTDTSLRRNQVLHDQIRRWIQGDDIVEALSPPSKRTRLSVGQPGSRTLTVHFVAPNGTFSRLLPTTLSLADLHHITFCGMQGAYVNLSLHVQDRDLTASRQSMVKAGVCDGCEIAVRLGVQPCANQDGYKEMCLIKVYNRFNSHEAFRYWVPFETRLSMASTIFRNWRYKGTEWTSSTDCDIWIDCTYTGDEHFSRTILKPWDSLASKPSSTFSSVILPSEALYPRPLDSTSNPKPMASHFSRHEGQADERPDKGHLPCRVLKVALYKHKTPKDRETRVLRRLRLLTRLSVSKQIFGSFVNRMIAYNYPASVGLVTFGDTAVLEQDLTAQVENFRHAIDNIKGKGDTALWDALALATDRLRHYSEKYPDARKRIICLSDGLDTNSHHSIHDVCRTMVHNGIVLDSCIIGSGDNWTLRTLSYLTGGYKFVPKCLEEAVAICELEPVLSQHERPPIVRPMAPALITPQTLPVASEHASADPVTRDNFPARKAHPRLGDQFVRIGTLKRMARSTERSVDDSNHTSKSILRSGRLLSEIQEIAAHRHPYYDVYVSESNMGFWKIVLQGPPDSAYSAGTFVLYLDAGREIVGESGRGWR